MYRINATHHAPTDVRILAPFFLDDEWARVFTARVLEQGHVPHNITPDDVTYVHEKDDGMDKFFIEVDAVEKKQHDAIVSAFIMLIIQMDVSSTDTMTDGEALGAMLLDSGMDPAEIDHIMGSAENWRTTTTTAANYGILQ